MSVYFVSARELDLVKIGYAFNPVRRYLHLRTFSPVELTLEGAIPGGFEKERELHRRFALARVRGEWFKLSPGLQGEIDASSCPEEFTWASVRMWLKGLAKQSEVLEPALAAEVREERLREFSERAQVGLTAKAMRAGMTQLQRLEADGAIHFPFRERQPA